MLDCLPVNCVLLLYLDGYYSNQSARYLIYSNPVRDIWQKNGNSDREQLEALKSALAIGQITGRIVILPRFHCKTRKRNVYSECPLNSFIAIARFDSQFATKYRESSFLGHWKVPDSVRENATSVLTVVTNSSQSVPTCTVSSIVAQFSSITSRVLSLEQLYGLQVTFDSAEENLAFNNATAKAFKRSNYRQYNMM